ncbi:MAG: hypothetical protein V1755_05245 [Chloroflexota bacterium]
MIPAQFLPPLRKIHASLINSGVNWAITGSLGMALQGMDLPINDIDLQTDEDGAYEIERRLAEYVVVPVLYKASEQMRSRLGKLSIEGLKVEVIGGMQKRSQDGVWEAPVDITAHRRWVEVEGLSIPVLSLEHEYEAYRLMGRHEKAEKIRQWLDKQARA